jgi:hypothetical protein
VIPVLLIGFGERAHIVSPKLYCPASRVSCRPELDTGWCTLGVFETRADRRCDRLTFLRDLRYAWRGLVTGLLLARGTDRRREIAFRLAVGASRGRIVSQLLAEAAVLGATGGLLGAAAGWAVFRGLLAIRPERLARIEEPQLLWSVLAYTALASLTATFLVAVIPAVQGVRVSYMEAMRARGQGWLSRAQRSAGRVLVIGEITLGFVLVTGAALAARTLFNIEHVRPGFEPSNVLAFQLPGMPPAQLAEWETRFAAIPGVRAAGAISHLPFDTTLPNWYGEYRARIGARLESRIMPTHRTSSSSMTRWPGRPGRVNPLLASGSMRNT